MVEKVVINIRCPHCKEALAIRESEVNTPVECPMCKKVFVWAEILRKRQEEKRAKRERVMQILAERQAKHRQLLEARRQKKEVRRKEKEAQIAAQREAAQKEEAALREIRWRCAQCGNGLCQLDLDSGDAVWESGKAYCRTHVPRTHPCPDCGKEISKQAPLCPHCGREFSKTLDLVPTQRPQPAKYEDPLYTYPARRERPRPAVDVIQKTTAGTGFKLGFFGCLGIAAAGILLLIVLAALGGAFSSSSKTRLSSQVDRVEEETRPQEVEWRRHEKITPELEEKIYGEYTVLFLGYALKNPDKTDIEISNLVLYSPLFEKKMVELNVDLIEARIVAKRKDTIGWRGW